MESKKIMKQLLTKITVLFFCILVLAGCSPKEKSVEEIKKDLMNHQGFYSTQSVSIDSLSIIKRQTDKKEKRDIVYVDVTASNHDIKCELSYELKYELYNEGWILDDVNPYETGNWKITPLSAPDRKLADSIMGQQYNNWEYFDSSVDLASKACTFYYNVNYNYAYLQQIREIAVTLRFNEYSASWEKSDIDTINTSGQWNLDGIWYPDGSYWYDRFAMLIVGVDSKTAFIKVYNVHDGTVYFNDTLEIDPTNGTDFDVVVSSSDWDTLDVFIKPDKIYIDGRGTRSNCLVLRGESISAINVSEINNNRSLLGDTLTLTQCGNGVYRISAVSTPNSKQLQWMDNFESYYDASTDCYIWYNTDVSPHTWQYWYDGISSNYESGWMEFDNGRWYIEMDQGEWERLPSEYSTLSLWYID